MFVETTSTRKIAALNARIRAVQGGSSAGKTISILMILISYAQSAGHRQAKQKGWPTEPLLISVVSESLPHLKKGAIRNFLDIMQTHKYFKDDSWNRTDFTYTFETGSKIEFFSVDQPDKVKGPRRDILFVNEAPNIDFETFEQLEIRTKSCIFMDWNPNFEFWFYTEMLPNRKDIDHIILTYKDNEGLSQEIVTALEQKRYRKNWARVYLDGQLGEIEGKIYTDWKIISEIPHEARLERYGLDFGYTNDPTAIVAVYYYNGGYILDEVCYQTGMQNRDIATLFKQLPRKMIVADSAEPKSIADIKMYGLNIVPAKKGKDSIRNGIANVQAQQISVTRNSTNLLTEYRKYLWACDHDGKVIKPEEPDVSPDHALDAVRYAMASVIPLNARREMFGDQDPRDYKRPNKAR